MTAIAVQSRLFRIGGYWWLFCLFIVALNFLLLAFDPLPKVYLGDSGCYLWTALSGWIPPDRSFLYGYVIRWSSLGTESITSLLILQTFVGAITSILVAFICRWIFGLCSGLSYLFGLLCALDPLQLVWQRYIMTETVSLFLYILMLLLSFLYLKQRRLWQLVIVQVLAVLVISFRMSYLLVIQISTFFLPLIAFFPEIRSAFRKHSCTKSRMSAAKSAGSHLALAILLMFLLLQGYQRVNGWLAHREPSLLHTSGVTMLATWAPALKPTDSPDPRLSELIAKGDQFHLKDMWFRNSQLYAPGYLVDQWKNIEPNLAIQNQVAKKTALHALLHRPVSVLKLGAKAFLRHWDLRLMHTSAKADLEITFPWDSLMQKYAARFHMTPPRRDEAKTHTLLQRYQLIAQPYYYLVLLSPFACGYLLFFAREGYRLLLFLHSWILLATISLLAMGPSVRYLQPMSLLTILIGAALVKSVADRRFRSASGGPDLDCRRTSRRRKTFRCASG
jgi:hypothetical protein